MLRSALIVRLSALLALVAVAMFIASLLGFAPFGQLISLILIALSICLAGLDYFLLADRSSVKQSRFVFFASLSAGLVMVILADSTSLLGPINYSGKVSSTNAKLPSAPAPPPLPPLTAPASAPKNPAHKEAEIIKPGSGVGAGPGAATDAADKMTALRQAIEALPKGNIALSAPTKMTVGDQNKVKASVGLNVPMQALQQQLGLGPNDQKVEGSLYLSPDMAATLNGSGFTIEPTTPEQQSLAEGFLTVWTWNVTAKQDGEQALEATLYVLVGDGDKTSRIRVESFTQKINVSVRPQTWGEWLASLSHEIGDVKSGLTALGATVTLILGWLGIRRISPNKKRGSKKPKNSKK